MCVLLTNSRRCQRATKLQCLQTRQESRLACQTTSQFKFQLSATQATEWVTNLKISMAKTTAIAPSKAKWSSAWPSEHVSPSRATAFETTCLRVKQTNLLQLFISCQVGASAFALLLSAVDVPLSKSEALCNRLSNLLPPPKRPRRADHQHNGRTRRQLQDEFERFTPKSRQNKQDSPIQHFKSIIR
jgi:hypothetical protein